MGELVWDARCGVGESCVWDAARRRVLFCDIPAGRINALNVDDGARMWWDFPEPVGSFGLSRSGRLVVALRHRVVLFDPATGDISNRRRFADLTVEQGYPDGAAMDEHGHYWSAGVTSGRLNRFTPDRVLAESVPFPVPTPTMPCFANGWLYGTSMRDGVSEDHLADFPDMGGLFRLPVAVRGAPISLFADGGFA
jgi:sugar lactone lactonase YvrE